jgi:hypothetical protein
MPMEPYLYKYTRQSGVSIAIGRPTLQRSQRLRRTINFFVKEHYRQRGLEL